MARVGRPRQRTAHHVDPLACLGQRFGLFELQQGATVPFLQQVQADDRQVRIEGIGIEQQNAVNFLICLVASLQLYVRKEAVQVRLTLISVQCSGLVHGFDRVFIITVLEFHFAKQQIGRTVL